MKCYIYLLPLLLMSSAFAQPTSRPATQPTFNPPEELERRILADGTAVTLTLERVAVPDPRAGGRPFMELAYTLRTDIGRQSVVLWRGSIRGSVPADLIELVQVMIRNDLAIVVYNQSQCCWGEVTRFRAGDEPTVLIRRGAVVTSSAADFGSAAGSAIIFGQFADRSLTIRVVDAKRDEARAYQLAEPGSRNSWVLKLKSSASADEKAAKDRTDP